MKYSFSVSNLRETCCEKTLDNLYDNLQSTYRPQYATETAVLKIHHDIVSGLDNRKCTILASLDLSASFDTVDHTIFIARIQQLYGVDNVCKDWFESV